MLDSNQLIRYSRQLILKDIGVEGQEKLLKAKMLVVGAGGLGAPALYYLASAGVGTLGVIDFDAIGLSNLQRQILYTTEDINKKKVDVAAERLKQLNPDINVVKYSKRLDINNIEEIISEFDVIIDAPDNFSTRYLVSDCCYFMKKPLIEGAVVGFTGILTTILPGESPCYRCLYPKPPRDGHVAGCADIGILGAVAGTIGSLQAMEAIKVYLGIGEVLSGRVLSFNGLDIGFNEIMLEKNKHCPLCGENPEITELHEYQMNYCASKVKSILKDSEEEE